MNHFWLVVEDSREDMLLIHRVCSRLPSKVEFRWAPNGIEGRDYLVAALDPRHEFPLPSLILCDIDMPLMNGLELLAWTKQKEALAAIPFVVLTGSNDEANRKLALQLGAQAYFVKPGNLNGLANIVREVQSQWATRQQGEFSPA